MLKGSPIASVFDPRANSFNLIRLCLATVVIFSHAIPLGGVGPPAGGPTSIVGYFETFVINGGVAVDAFFGLSGFLITRSWLSQKSLGRFLWHRVLRIFPAFWASLLLTALVIAPICVAYQGHLSAYWSAPDGPFSFIRNDFLLWMGQYEISGSPANVPFPGTWNGSAWSLYWEFLCYLAVALLGVFGILKRRRQVVLVLFVVVWIGSIVRLLFASETAPYFPDFRPEYALRLALMFLAGSVMHLYSDKIKMSGRLATIAAVVYLGSFMLLSAPRYGALGGVALIYFLIWFGTRIHARFGARNDISYGVYIYAFPIQQMLVIFGLNRWGWLAYSLLGVAVTVPVALASWFLIERRALKMKDWRPEMVALPAGLRLRAGTSVGVACVVGVTLFVGFASFMVVT